MAARPSWDGFLKFNLISVPVKAYSATASGGGKIGFHLIHKGCNSRIRYKKVCPIHGEVGNDEIVSAYEHAKGQYIVVDAAESKGLRLEDEKAIAIDVFISPDQLDPLYYTERSYYLVPDGKVAQKPYAVLRAAMAQEERYALAQVVFSGQGRLAVVRPLENLLAMTLLSYQDQLKKASTFEDELSEQDVSAEERKLAESLIQAASAKDVELGRYKDEYTARLVKLLEGRAKGKKVVTAPGQEEEPAVINLMDALRRSLDQARRGPAKKGPGSRGGQAGPHGARRAEPAGNGRGVARRGEGRWLSRSTTPSARSTTRPSRAGRAGAAAVPCASWFKSTRHRACTTTSAWSWTACSRAGPSRNAPP